MTRSETDSGGVLTAWLGTAGVWIACGETSLLVDGFFTRPSLLRVAFSRLRPDPARVDQGLRRAGIAHLTAVLAGHAHYDHSLDAIYIAQKTGAIVAGSASFANLALGAGMPADRIQIVQPGDRTAYHRFQVEWISSRHNRPNLAHGEIKAVLPTPAHASQFSSGTCFALRLNSPSGILGVMGSAGYQPGMFTGRPVDALFLSIAGLSRTSSAEFEAFFRATVIASQARVIYPIHWDDFFHPAGPSPVFLPRLIDNVRASLARLESLCRANSIRVVLPPFFQPFPPFSDVK
jgi:L-ascorbate metabolism protein UlaG (beta-lactamase superfamily)